MKYDQQYTDYQTRRSSLRKWIRRFYLNNILRHVDGPTIDFGCGAGELLAGLPAGSIGLEVNSATVAYCRARGLDVRLYDPAVDEYRLDELVAEGRRFTTMTTSHVLEHLPDPLGVLNKLLRSAGQLGVRRIVVIVPGKRGFASDSTHVTYVTKEMLLEPTVVVDTGYRVTYTGFFPVNLEYAGRVFVHNELLVLYSDA